MSDSISVASTSRIHSRSALFSSPVWIAALGYFVDVFDLVLFGVVRVESLKSFGLGQEEVMQMGAHLLNLQMLGVIVGGIVWGILGDYRGRLSVLLGSIFLYSMANFLNGFVTNVEMYGVLRFIAGFGLAGELGAAITLISEILPRSIRGYGTTIVASLGLVGAIAASLIGQMLSWQSAFIVGGSLGFCLLFLRSHLHESELFKKSSGKRKVDFLMLFSPSRFSKYLYCILLGIPIWFSTGILMVFAPEFAKHMGVIGEVTAGTAIMFNYIGGVSGDLICGILSQRLQSRKKAMGGFLALTAIFLILFGSQNGISSSGFYALCLLSGLGCGYFAMFVTVSAEQFGTNLRATVATTVPNFVRGAVVPLLILFQYLSKTYSIMNVAMVLGAACLILAIFACWKLDETFGKNLEFLEE